MNAANCARAVASSVSVARPSGARIASLLVASKVVDSASALPSSAMWSGVTRPTSGFGDSNIPKIGVELAAGRVVTAPAREDLAIGAQKEGESIVGANTN